MKERQRFILQFFEWLLLIVCAVSRRDFIYLSFVFFIILLLFYQQTLKKVKPRMNLLKKKKN